MRKDRKTLEELLREITPPRFQEGDLTIAMAAEAMGISHKMAESRLNELVKQGKAEKFKGYGPTERLCWIWRLKADE